MPNFTLQKGEGCPVSVVEKAIMKNRKLNGIQENSMAYKA